MSIVWGPENLRPGTTEQWIRPWCSRYWLAPAWHSYTCCSPHSFLITINIHCIPTLCSVCRGTRHVNISLKLTCDWFFYAKYLHIHEGCCKNLILLYNFHLRNSLYMKNKFFVFLLFLWNQAVILPITEYKAWLQSKLFFEGLFEVAFCEIVDWTMNHKLIHSHMAILIRHLKHCKVFYAMMAEMFISDLNIHTSILLDDNRYLHLLLWRHLATSWEHLASLHSLLLLY